MGMQKLNSNPFTLATSFQSSSPEKTLGQAADSFIIPQPRMRALHSQAASLQRALSKQDYNVNLGALSGIVDVIDESNSTAECGLTSNSLKIRKNSTNNSGENISSEDAAALQHVNSFSVQPPDSPTDTIKTG